MVNFVCEACGHRFEREKEAEECPWCGEKGVIIKEKTADELIKNSEE